MSEIRLHTTGFTQKSAEDFFTALRKAGVRRHIEDLLKGRGLILLREIVEEASFPVSYDEARLVRAWAKVRRTAS